MSLTSEQWATAVPCLSLPRVAPAASLARQVRSVWLLGGWQVDRRGGQPANGGVHASDLDLPATLDRPCSCLSLVHALLLPVGLGKRGVPAEEIGALVAGELMDALASGACTDEWLQDQLIIFMALAQVGCLFAASWRLC